MSPEHRLEVGFILKTLDSAANSVETDIRDDLGISSRLVVRSAEVYYFEGSEGEARQIAQKAIIDPLVQQYSLDRDLYKSDFFVEVAFHKGVTDNLAIITKEAIEDFLGRPVDYRIRTSRRYYFTGKADPKTIRRIATELLSNGIIENFTIGGKK